MARPDGALTGCRQAVCFRFITFSLHPSSLYPGSSPGREIRRHPLQAYDAVFGGEHR